jgi:hypothetical protein
MFGMVRVKYADGTFFPFLSAQAVSGQSSPFRPLKSPINRPKHVPRIPLARIMLQTIIDVSKHHPSVYAVCMISLIVQTAFSVFYSFAAIAVYVTWTPGNPCECNVDGGRSSKRMVRLNRG